MPMDSMTANSRLRRMRPLVTVLNTLARAMSVRMNENRKQNTFTTVTIMAMDCSWAALSITWLKEIL